MLRGVEVRLADAQVDDVPAAFLEPGRERKDLADQRRLKAVQYLAQLP
jgi:hypothetical protein